MYKDQEREKEKEDFFVDDQVMSDQTEEESENCTNEKVRRHSGFESFVLYMSLEHEYLLTFIIFAPLLFTSFYIKFIE